MKPETPSDKVKQSIRNVFWLYVGLFAAVVVYLSYFILFSSPQIVNDPHNPRLGVLDSEMKRGAIFDNDGHTLVYSERNGDSYERKYVYDKNLCHLLGYVGMGKSGIEARYNFELQKLHHEVWQRTSQLFSGTELKGNSLFLTVNLETQKAAFESLGKKKGAVIAIEPDTGKILAMASYPNFDPNTISSNWSELDESEEAPFINRASQGLYTPGSVFKIITAAALIENGENYSEIIYECVGEAKFKDKIIHCFDGRKHGEIGLYEAFAYSCNTFFAEDGMEIGTQSLIDSAADRYFNMPLDYALEYSKSIFQLPENATEPEIVETAIGQGRTLVSPLHIALITSAIANEGVMMKPYVVDHINAYSDKTISKNLPKMLGAPFATQEAAVLKEMMYGVVENGTGGAAKINGVYVAGKTGTAENPNGNPHSWFTSFAEKDGKKVAVTVVLENPEEGQSAVPIAKKVLEAALNNLQQ